MRVCLSVVSSILLHAGLSIWVLQIRGQAPKQSPVRIELQTHPVEPPTSDKKGTRKVKTPSKSSENKKHLARKPGPQLLPTHMVHPYRVRSSSPFAAGGIQRDWHEPWGATGGPPLQELKSHRFYHHLHELLENHITYPVALGVREISGIVQVRMVIRKDGHCQNSLIKINGGQRPLRNLVFHGIRGLCRRRTDIKPRKKHQMVDVSVAFEVLNHGATTHHHNGFFGNVIHVHKRFRRMDIQQKANYFVQEKLSSTLSGRDPLEEFQHPLD